MRLYELIERNMGLQKLDYPLINGIITV